MKEFVDIEIFKQQVWNVEGVKIDVSRNGDHNVHGMVRPYIFDRLPDDAIVDDLKARLDYCLNHDRYVGVITL